MPHRTLGLNEVAEYLHLGRKDLEMLVKRNEIPFETQGDRVVFRKRQIDAWASQRILGLSGTGLADYHRVSSAKYHDLSPRHALMPELVSTDRIEPALSSRTKPSVLRDMVALAERTQMVCDGADLLASLEEREKMCSTALGEGIALLHPRHHEPYAFMDSFIVVGRATQPIHAGAPDGKPTDIFFLVCCQDDRIHLHTLARVCAMCRNTGMLNNLRAASGAADMLKAILAAEEEVIRHL